MWGLLKEIFDFSVKGKTLTCPHRKEVLDMPDVGGNLSHSTHPVFDFGNNVRFPIKLLPC